MNGTNRPYRAFLDSIDSEELKENYRSLASIAKSIAAGALLIAAGALLGVMYGKSQAQGRHVNINQVDESGALEVIVTSRDGSSVCKIPFSKANQYAPSNLKSCGLSGKLEQQ